MQLTQEQIETFMKWLESRWGKDHKCICGHDDWLVSDRVFEISEHNLKSPLNSVVQPIVPVICKFCGHTIYVNAIIAGVVESKGIQNEKK